MSSLSGWPAFGLYTLVILLMPCILWFLWFISVFCSSYFAGDHLDEGDLNYFNLFDDQEIVVINILSWIFWPLGLSIALLITMGFVIRSLLYCIVKNIDSYFGESKGSVFNFHALTTRLNHINTKREKKALDRNRKPK